MLSVGLGILGGAGMGLCPPTNPTHTPASTGTWLGPTTAWCPGSGTEGAAGGCEAGCPTVSSSPAWAAGSRWHRDTRARGADVAVSCPL